MADKEACAGVPRPTPVFLNTVPSPASQHRTVMDDLSNDARGRVRAYATDYYAEFYDIWNGSFWGRHFLDEETHWTTLQDLINKHKDRSEPITIADIGAGSGRQIKDILERAHESHTSLPNTKIYAIDQSKAMLKRGEKYLQARPRIQEICPVDWVEADAESFTSVLPQLKGSCDLVLWAGGGFSHLCSEDAQFAFLLQLKAALRSPEGIGLISILDQSIPSRADPKASEVFEVPYENMQSVDDPEISYDKSANEVVWKGPVRHDRWTVSLKKDGEKLHSEDIEHTLMNLDEEGWLNLVAKAGLRISRIIEMKGMGLYYCLQTGA